MSSYRTQRSWGKVMFLQASVILSTGGGSASVHAGITPPPSRSRHTPQEQAHPPSRHPPGAGTPPEQAPPLAQSMLGDTVNARAVRILLECKLVYSTSPLHNVHVNPSYTNPDRDISSRHESRHVLFRLLIFPLASLQISLSDNLPHCAVIITQSCSTYF